MEAGLKKTESTPREREASDPPEASGEAIRLSYDSVHDLVGPANQVCTLTSLLLKQYGDRLGTEADALVDLIRGSMNRLQNLLGGFRLYAQIAGKSAAYQMCDANVLLAGALASIQGTIRDSGAMVTHDPLPELCCDGAQIGYVFASLVDNAIKFRSQERPKIHVSAEPRGNDWVFGVADNGIGIDAKYHKRIFEMFKRVHNDTHPGAGAGLAIAGRIIQGHRGRIWVESELGGGAKFFFTLPVAATG